MPNPTNPMLPFLMALSPAVTLVISLLDMAARHACKTRDACKKRASQSFFKSPKKLNNIVRLNKIGYQDEILEKMICPISFCIMTEPVYHPATPQYICDKKSISDWLELQSTHPCTRGTVDINEFIPHEKLQQEIDDFVSTQEKIHNAPELAKKK
ncbi:MAG: hypothetical protein H2069_01860 [Legionella sp.]|nr:hypothetical protein [Legionella sp.]